MDTLLKYQYKAGYEEDGNKIIFCGCSLYLKYSLKRKGLVNEKVIEKLIINKKRRKKIMLL